MPAISACLWLDDQAEQAAEYYTSMLPGSKVTGVTCYTEAGQELHGHEPGSAMTVDFEMGGFRFTALNGGPYFAINPSISFFIRCGTRAEVDRLWETLADGGQTLMPLDAYPWNERYGWVQDRYGVSWQVIYADAGPRRIVPALMFVGDQCGHAEEAIRFYCSAFRDATIGDIARYGADQAPETEGNVMYAEFRLEGQPFVAMDSAQDHQFAFNEAVSLAIDARTQEEIDDYWSKLSADPEAEQCGWLKDRYGVSWQVFPASEMNAMLRDKNRDKVNAVAAAMYTMKKIDLAALRAAGG